MKLFGDEGLKKRLKTYWLIIIIPIIIIILAGLLVRAVGLVGDIIAKPRLNQLRDEAHAYFEEFRSQGGYIKPQYNEDVEEGNAWDFYSQAVNTIEPMSDSEGKTVINFLRGKEVDTAQVALILLRYEGALNDVRRGLKQTKCLFPLEYEKGAAAPVPNFMALRGLAKLLAAHGRLSQSMGRPDQAARDYLDVARFGQDITGGHLTLIGHMVGIVTLGIGAEELGNDITTFSFGEETLINISSTLNELSKTWPSIELAFNTEVHLIAISASMTNSFSTYTPQHWKELKYRSFLEWWFLHLYSWSSFFSTNRAWASAIPLLHQYYKKAGEIENSPWIEWKSIEEEFDKKLAESNNWMATTATTNFFAMTRRKMERILNTKLNGTAALAQLYYLQNSTYPSTLNDVEAGKLGDLLIDPMTHSLWEYRVFADGDSCTISSPYSDKKSLKITSITLGPPG
jgi:hypothetical protein